MKRLGLGFAALIAVLTMSFTVANQQGAFKATKANSKAIVNCYAVLYDAAPVISNACNFVTPPCDPAIVGKPISSSLTTPDDCDGQSGVFCCAYLTVDNQRCLTHPVLSSFLDINGTTQTSKRARIADYVCKPQ